MSKREKGKPPIRLGRRLRAFLYYTVEQAGSMLAWSRAEAYRAAARGEMPLVRQGKLFLVPRRDWDAIVQHVRDYQPPKAEPAPQETASAEPAPQSSVAKRPRGRPRNVQAAPEGATVEA